MSLIPYCKTDRQREVVELIEAGNSQRATGKLLGMKHQNVNVIMRDLKRLAAVQGYSPQHDMTRTVPQGFVVKGVSTFYDKDGKPRGQWVKSRLDQDALNQLMLDTIETVGESFRGTSRVTAAPRKVAKDLCAVIPIGDPHFGMYSWKDETGDDFDCEIAERNLIGAMRRCVDNMPECNECVILNLGDFFHSDTLENKTRRSGNALDVDSRWQRVLQIGIRAMRACIDHALTRHKRVTVRNNIGNHDEQSSVMLGLALKMYYENNKRVTVDCSPNPFWFYQFGANLIGSTHGDRTKPQDLPGIMATDAPEMWGAAKHRYWYIGHVHHRKAHEFPGCMVESFRTLAAKDAWHNASGYRSGRDLVAILLHRQFGEIERHTIDLSYLEGDRK